MKGSEEAIARSVDLLAIELPQPAANESVVLLEQRTPRRIPELGRTLCGADDVGEEDRCENSIRFPWPADARQEPLGLAHRLLMHRVVDPGEQTVQAGQLNDLASGDPLGDVLRLGAL